MSISEENINFVTEQLDQKKFRWGLTFFLSLIFFLHFIVNLKPIGDKKKFSQKKCDCVRKLVSSPKLFKNNKWPNFFLRKDNYLGEESCFVTQCIHFVWKNWFCHPNYLKRIGDEIFFSQKISVWVRKVISSPNVFYFAWEIWFRHLIFLKQIGDKNFTQKISSDHAYADIRWSPILVIMMKSPRHKIQTI